MPIITITAMRCAAKSSRWNPRIMDEFALRALAAGSMLAAVAGPLGCFVVWRRMAYFGDALSHSALLGAALGVLISIAPDAAIVIVCLGFAALLPMLERRSDLSRDTFIGIVAQAALALGVVLMSMNPAARVDLLAYLFGDILSVDNTGLLWMLAGAVAILIALRLLWRPLLAISVHEELARVEGVRVHMVRAVLMALIALTVAGAVKLMGVLLVSSMLIIPAAASRSLARGPEHMAFISIAFGLAAVWIGIAVSLGADIATGPAIVLAAAALFALSRLLPARLGA
jgi:zinc transport system permease protein